MNYTTTQRAHYNQDREMTCQRLGITGNQYNWFRKMGQELHKIYEDNCNGIINNEQEYDNLVQPIYQKVDYKAAGLGLHTYYQTDPRGATIYLSKSVISENSYNTSAECIY